MQLNATYCKAIKAIPYEVVFNRKPNFKSVEVGTREITLEDVEDQEIEDEADDSIINESLEQEAMEDRVRKQLEEQESREHEAMEEAHQAALTRQITLTANDAILSEEQARFADRVEERENETVAKTSGPSTPPNRRPENGLFVDPDLLSPRLDRLRLNPSRKQEPEPQELDSQPTTTLRQQVRINQQHANERSKRQYGKQRQTTIYELGSKVSVAVPALDRASTDDKRIFGRGIGVIVDYDIYLILT